MRKGVYGNPIPCKSMDFYTDINTQLRKYLKMIWKKTTVVKKTMNIIRNHRILNLWLLIIGQTHWCQSLTVIEKSTSQKNYWQPKRRNKRQNEEASVYWSVDNRHKQDIKVQILGWYLKSKYVIKATWKQTAL